MADFLDVHEVLDNLDLQESMAAGEFGCGSADFTIVLAKKLSKGKVYALDIQEEKLSALKSKLALQNLNNVSLVLCDLEAPNGSGLQNGSLDIVLIPNVLFQAENKSAILQEAKRVLKQKGTLLIIDWLAGAPFGPKEKLLPPEEIKTMAIGLGFSIKKEFAAGNYHYALLFTR